MTPARLAALVVIAAFGPYLLGGLRTEQIAVYGITALVALRTVGSNDRLHPGIVGLMALWAVILSVSIISGMFPPPGARLGAPLSGVDALLAPLCLMFLMAAWARRPDFGDVLLAVQKWTVLLLCINAVVAVLMGFVELTPTLATHWWSGAEGVATGELAARSGRYGGIFNTPLAAGTAYGVGLIALGHLYLTRTWTGWKVALAAVALLVGGLMPQSKMFMLAALPIAVALLVAASSGRRVGVALRASAVVLLAYWGLSQTLWWNEFGQYRVSHLLAGSQDPLMLYTAGRYGDATAVGGIRETVLETAPWGGYGTRVALGALDTSWVEMLGRAGLIGLAAFVAWLVGAVLIWAHRRNRVPRVQWWAAGAMLLVTVAAATGGPSLTQNRAGTLLLMNLLPLLVAHASSRSRTAASAPAR